MSSHFTTYLFARPSFFEGMSRAIDLFGLMNRHYNRSETPNEADYRALRADWLAVGEDMWTAIEQFENDQALKKPIQ